MKKWITWGVVISVLTFLTTRISTHHVSGVKSERLWYIEQLHFEFSGKLDNLDFPDRVLFRVTSGQLDIEREKAIKEQLKYNGMLDLLLYRDDGRLDLMIIDPHEYINGDSLYLNSGLKIVRFYRNGEFIGEHNLIKSLRGRPF